MSYLTSGSTADPIVHRAGIIDVSSETQLTVMLKFKTDASVSASNYIVATNSTGVLNGYQLSIAATAPTGLLVRARTNGGVHSVNSTFVAGDIQTIFAKIDLVTQEMTGYFNGVPFAPVATGTTFFSNNFEFKLQGGIADDNDFEVYESAYWIGHAISDADVAAYQAGADLDSLSVPPTELYRLNGVQGTLADPLPASVLPANDLLQVSGATTPPDWPVWGVPSIAPPPPVPAGYTRYTTDIATADTTTPESFFFGIAVEDGMLVDIPDYMNVLLVGGLATGFLTIPPPPDAPPLPITVDFFYYYPSNGNYESEEFTFSAPAGGGVFMSGGLGFGIGIGLDSFSSFFGAGVDPQPPEPTLYVNPELAGGTDLNDPPDNHGSGFDTTTGVVADEYAPGFFGWLFNPEEVSGRGYLTYQLFQNNPGLTVGETYVFSYQVQKLNAGNYGATLNAASLNNVTVVSTDVVIFGNTTKRCSIVFTVDAPIYSAQFRIGNGTTSNNTAHMLYTRPRLEVASPAGDYSPDDFSSIDFNVS